MNDPTDKKINNKNIEQAKEMVCELLNENSENIQKAFYNNGQKLDITLKLIFSTPQQKSEIINAHAKIDFTLNIEKIKGERSIEDMNSYQMDLPFPN